MRFTGTIRGSMFLPFSLVLARYRYREPGRFPAGDLSHAAVSMDLHVTVPLDQALPGITYAVHEVVYPTAVGNWPQRLEEIGFLPGERVMVLRRGVPGGDPLAVRVGHSTFALRKSEAACVRVRLWPAGEGGR
jgi:ferrous iron transport protein A